jgi:hypothetical protein
MTLSVIPDAAQRRSGIHNPSADDLNAAGYGFRVRTCGAPRNDVVRLVKEGNAHA